MSDLNQSTACEGCSHPGICKIHGCAADSVQARQAVLHTTISDECCGQRPDPAQQTTSADALLIRAAELEKQGWALLDEAAILRRDANKLEALRHGK